MTETDRREQLAREHAERQAKRAEQESRGKRNVALGVGLGAVVVIGGIIAAATLLGGGGDDGRKAAADPSASASADASASTLPEPTPSAPAKAAATTCEYRDDDTGAPAKDVGRPPAKVSKAVLNLKTMTIKTNHGDIVIDLFTDRAPCTVNSFAFLAKKGFFDNTVCHRLATPETAGLGLLQCGDPQAKGDGKNPTDGTGGPGYLFNDENIGGSDYRRGVVFMALGGDDKNANGSQFAISYSDDNTQLASVGSTYTAFGTISKGMEIVDKVSKGGVIINEGDITSEEGGSTAPKLPVKVKTVILR